MGSKIGEGTFSLATAPQDSSIVKLQLPALADGETTLEVYAMLKNATPLLAAGHEVAREQFVTGNWQDGMTTAKADAASDIVVEIDEKSGLIATYTIGGESVFEKWNGPEPYFWRAPTDNDFGNKMPQKMGVWRQVQTNRRVQKCTVTDTEEGKRYEFDMVLSDIEQPYKLTYIVGKDGSIRTIAEMNTTGRKNLPELPRFGMRFIMPEASRM